MLSKRLVYLRKNKNKTQEDIAKVVGVTRPAYTAYERGSRTPDYETIKTLANYYGVTTDYLLGHSDDPHETEDPEFEDFIQNVRRWYKEAPKDREEDLQRLKRIFEAYKNDE